MNCAGMAETLLETELFGHVKGSFTGAYRDKAGILELGDRGTVFLDEIGEMTLRMQGLLLRFLETGELRRVGSDRGIARVNVRVISATNRDLRRLVAEGQFREDLFYRLNVMHLVVPPLRHRLTDIPLLVEHFLCRLNGHGKPKTVAKDAMGALVRYQWPGNIRELENVVERIMAKARGEVVTLADLPAELSAASITAPRTLERRRAIVDELYRRLREDRESFWTAVYPKYMRREITRENVRDVVRRGLEEARGNYRLVTKLFNMPPQDYKKFLDFLRKHECHLPFQNYRQ